MLFVPTRWVLKTLAELYCAANVIFDALESGSEALELPPGCLGTPQCQLLPSLLLLPSRLAAVPTTQVPSIAVLSFSIFTSCTVAVASMRRGRHGFDIISVSLWYRAKAHSSLEQKGRIVSNIANLRKEAMTAL